MSTNSISSSLNTFLKYDFNTMPFEKKYLSVTENNELKVVDWDALSLRERCVYQLNGRSSLPTVTVFIQNLLSNVIMNQVAVDKERLALRCAQLSLKVKKHHQGCLKPWCNLSFWNPTKKWVNFVVYYPICSDIHPEKIFTAKKEFEVSYSIKTTFQKIQNHVYREMEKLGSFYFMRSTKKCELKAIYYLACENINVWSWMKGKSNQFTLSFEGIHLPKFAQFHQECGFTAGCQNEGDF